MLRGPMAKALPLLPCPNSWGRQVYGLESLPLLIWSITMTKSPLMAKPFRIKTCKPTWIVTSSSCKLNNQRPSFKGWLNLKWWRPSPMIILLTRSWIMWSWKSVWGTTRQYQCLPAPSDRDHVDWLGSCCPSWARSDFHCPWKGRHH